MTEQLFERDDELKLLNDMLASCIRCEGGGVVSISGVTATGKTALLRCTAEQVAQAGARFVMATGSSEEQALPLGIARQLLRGLGLTRGTDASTSLGVTLLELAERDPLVIAVDDTQYADRASLEVLLYLARRIQQSRLLLVIAHGGPVDRQFQADLLSQPHCARIKLGPLSPDGVASMITGQLDGSCPPGFAAACHEITGGNPLLVSALLEDLRVSRAPSAGAPVVGATYEEAVHRCLYRGTDDMLLVAQGAAILGESASSALIASLTGIQPVAVGQDVQALREAGLLDSDRFRHPAARDATLRSLPATRRAALHHRAAELLFWTGASAACVAQHLVSAGPPGERWECDVLSEAADTALAQGEPEFAVTCLHHVLLAGDASAQGAVYDVLLASAKWRVNPVAAGRHLDGMADAIRGGQLTGGYAVEAIFQLLWRGRLDEATLALDHLSRTADPAARIELGRASGWLVYAHPPLSACIPAPPASEAAPGPWSGDANPRCTQVLAAALRGGRRAGGRDTELVAEAEQILQHPHLNDQGIGAVLAALLAMSYADRPVEAAAWGRTLLGRAEQAQLAPTWYALLNWVAARSLLHAGDLEQAEKHAQAALAEIHPQSWGVAIGGPLAVLVQASTAMGNLAQAARYLSQPVPSAMFESMFGLDYLHARGRYDLAANRAAAALKSFEACGELMTDWQIDRPVIVPWRSDAARALVVLGEQHKARQLVRTQLGILDQGSARTRGITLRVYALVSESRERRNLLCEAVDLLQSSGDLLELSYALTELSQTYYVLGETNQARLALRRARRLAEEGRIKPLLTLLQPVASSAADERLPAAEPGNGLSEAEARVAVLAARGHTNREIASKLFITVSTVEQHLTRIYRKLSITKRSDLPVNFREHGQRRHRAPVSSIGWHRMPVRHQADDKEDARP